ncbi:MAG: type II toxin-antitoxin system VapC family toxin [Veillonellaceae bacterium]|nr:type II toxin-antitoxin system VapC family toxin [Veillonellaceae bacterium]
MNYIIDTNIITALMKDREEVKTKAQEVILLGNNVFINGISYYEIKRGLLLNDAHRQMNFFERICIQFDLLFLDRVKIFDTAAEIWADLKENGLTIEDADILIASVAHSMNSVLVTDNIKHFENIEDLTVENWIDR